MEKTPWRKTVDPNFIGTYILPNDQPISAVITKVEWKMIKVMGQNKKQAIATFAPNPHFDKPMLLNVTNMKRLERLTESKYIEDWINVPVTLQREMDKTPTGGQDWALRVSVIKPKVNAQGKATKPKLTPESPNWADIIKWVQAGNAIDAVTKKYEVSEADMITFNEALEVKAEPSTDEPDQKEGEETND